MTQCDLVVTGATGFVGRHLVARAREEGADIQVVDWDLRDGALTAARLGALNPRGVAHLAAGPRGGSAWSGLEDDMRMVGSLLAALEATPGSPVVLVAGSAAQYGMGAPRLLSEADPTEPLSAYGAAKCVLERAVTAPALAGGVRVVWARAFNHVGPGQGDDAPAASWAGQIAAAELAGGGELRTGRLDVVRDFLDVRDVAAAYLALLRSPAEGVVNVCSGVATPLRDVADALVAQARCPIERNEDPGLMRSVDPPHVVGDPARLKELTGWSPQFDLEHSLRDLLEDRREAVRGGAAVESGVAK